MRSIEDGGESGDYFIHDFGWKGLWFAGATSAQIERAGLVAPDAAGRLVPPAVTFVGYLLFASVCRPVLVGSDHGVPGALCSESPMLSDSWTSWPAM